MIPNSDQTYGRCNEAIIRPSCNHEGKNHYTCYYFYPARVINDFNLATFERLNNVITRSTYTHFLVVFSWIIYITLFELMCRQSREQGATHFEKLSKIIKRIGNILMIIHWLKKKKLFTKI